MAGKRMPSSTMRWILLLLLAACSAAGPGPVRHWGTLREALSEGRTAGRVDAAPRARPGVFGIGAAAALDGEITIFDGVLFVSRVRAGRVETSHPATAPAAVLITSQVPAWHEVRLTKDLDPPAFATFVAAQAFAVGIDTRRPFPFAVTGRLRRLKLHVLAGECPLHARHLGVTPTSPPFEQQFEEVSGRLVGIHAVDAGGVLMHHGTSVHVHAIVDSAVPYTGHVEAVGLAAGAVLLLPKVRV